MEDSLNPENIGAFNIGALADIQSKQDAIMAMLSVVIAYQNGENSQAIHKVYQQMAKVNREKLINDYEKL